MASWRLAVVFQQLLFEFVMIPVAPQPVSSASPQWSSQNLIQEKKSWKIIWSVKWMQPLKSNGRSRGDTTKWHFCELTNLNVGFWILLPKPRRRYSVEYGMLVASPLILSSSSQGWDSSSGLENWIFPRWRRPDNTCNIIKHWVF